MSDQNEKLAKARKLTRDAARPEIVTKIANRGRLTARQRVDAVLDPDSAVEYGTMAAQTSDREWVPEEGGVDFIGAIDGHPAVVSSTDYSDHGGGYGAARLGRLFALAFEQRWPLVLFVDGGGSRAQHPRANQQHVELSGSIGRFSFLDVPELSGWTPCISIVSGPSFAGHASIAGFSDFLISTPGSSIGMGGPPMVEAALGQRLTAHELAGSEMHEQTGGIDLLVTDETAAIEAAKKYLAFYNERHLPEYQAPSVDNLDELDTTTPYDMHEVVQGILDRDSWFELRPNFACSVITGLGRIEGRSVGILANQPLVADGAIDHNAAAKISRFVEICNTYEYPIIALIDSPGCVSNWTTKLEEFREPGLTRWHTRPIIAHQQRTVPLLSVQIRRAGGLSGALMTGSSSTRGVAAAKFGWPEVHIGKRDGFSTTIDQNAFDDILVPSETRERLARIMRLLSKPPPRTSKKHWIDSW